MQTVFLCELLMRIRSGGRAVAGVAALLAAATAVRPSLLFASLCSRVSSSGSFASAGHASSFGLSSPSSSFSYPLLSPPSSSSSPFSSFFSHTLSSSSFLSLSHPLPLDTTFLPMLPAEQVVAPFTRSEQPRQEMEWRQWVQTEAQRRLCTACTLFNTPLPTMPMIGRTDTEPLWKAASAAEWAAASEQGSCCGSANSQPGR